MLVVSSSTVVINSLFGFCGQVHHESCNCFEKIKMRIHGSPKRFRKYSRIFQCLPQVKVGLGRTDNFVEKRTTVKYQQFTVQRIVDFILVNYRKREQILRYCTFPIAIQQVVSRGILGLNWLGQSMKYWLIQAKPTPENATGQVSSRKTGS